MLPIHLLMYGNHKALTTNYDITFMTSFKNVKVPKPIAVATKYCIEKNQSLMEESGELVNIPGLKIHFDFMNTI